MDTNYSPLVVRFLGPDMQGVPVCEMGDVLSAMNRMVYRAHMLSRHKTKALAGLPQDDRLRLALQIADVTQPPCTFHLDWFSRGSQYFLVEETEKLLMLVRKALLLYTHAHIRMSPKTSAEKLALTLFNDFLELANRIGKIGNIQTIEIDILDYQTIVIDGKVRDYIESLEGRSYDLERREIGGLVQAPRTLERNLFLLKAGQPRLIKVHAKEEKALRPILSAVLDVLSRFPDPILQPYFTFHGRPRLHIGDDPEDFTEFVLDKPYTPIKYRDSSDREHALAVNFKADAVRV